jgi:hypothetical protein
MSLLPPKAIDEFSPRQHQPSGSGRPRAPARSLQCQYQVSPQYSPEHVDKAFDQIFQKTLERWQQAEGRN